MDQFEELKCKEKEKEKAKEKLIAHVHTYSLDTWVHDPYQNRDDNNNEDWEVEGKRAWDKH